MEIDSSEIRNLLEQWSFEIGVFSNQRHLKRYYGRTAGKGRYKSNAVRRSGYGKYEKTTLAELAEILLEKYEWNDPWKHGVVNEELEDAWLESYVSDMLEYDRAEPSKRTLNLLAEVIKEPILKKRYNKIFPNAARTIKNKGFSWTMVNTRQFVDNIEARAVRVDV